MSQKAWMNAYSKGSKALQDRLAKIHANNPEFQEFVKKHGFGGNLSKKQSELQKKPSVATVKPVTDQNPERSNLDREAVIRAAAEKLRNRRQANANRVAFGGELGGGFQMPGGGFRRYSEAVEKWKVSDKDEKYATMKNAKGDSVRISRKTWNVKRGGVLHGSKSARGRFRPVGEETVNEAIEYKSGQITMHRGGWIALLNGKRVGSVVPTEDHAKRLLDSTHKGLAQKTLDVINRKRVEIARGLGRMSLATESAANRNRIRSWDSAILPVEHDHPLTTPHPKAKLDALRAAGKHVEARELERSWLRKSMAKAKKTENSK